MSTPFSVERLVYCPENITSIENINPTDSLVVDSTVKEITDSRGTLYTTLYHLKPHTPW